MFNAAITKIWLMFLALIVIISLFFSYNWYLGATDELRLGIKRGDQIIEKTPNLRRNKEVQALNQLRQAQLEESIENIRLRIFIANVVFIGLGALISYYLARKIVEPIQQANEKQRQFTADASHELRTPVAAMKAEIEVGLRDKKITKKEAEEILASNLEELAKIESLTTQLLTLARQDDPATSVDLHSVSLDRVISHSKESVEKIAKTKNITIEAKPSKLRVKANRDLLKDTLLILIENAVKYSPKNTTVVVKATDNQSSVRISVTDKGAGIDKRDQQKIFERFYRTDKSRTTNGHGLGLSIAQNNVNLMGSKIIVTSEIDKGSTFYFNLPKS